MNDNKPIEINIDKIIELIKKSTPGPSGFFLVIYPVYERGLIGRFQRMLEEKGWNLQRKARHSLETNTVKCSHEQWRTVGRLLDYEETIQKLKDELNARNGKLQPKDDPSMEPGSRGAEASGSILNEDRSNSISPPNVQTPDCNSEGTAGTVCEDSGNQAQSSNSE